MSSDFTINHGHAEYSDAELLEQARGNAQALILATVAFLEERARQPATIPLEDIERRLGLKL